MTDSKKTLDEKCWKGYKKKGMKTMFGKRYPNCVKVKKEGFSDWRSELEQIEEKTKLKNTNYGPAVVYQDNEKTVPARVRYQMPTGGDGTAYMGENKEPELPKFSQDSINKAKGASKSFVKKTPKALKGTAKGLTRLGTKGKLVAAGLVGSVIAGRAITRGVKNFIKKRKDAAIEKQVDKYVSDRKAPIKKVNYMPDNMYTVKRDKDGKVSGTGDKIRVVPGTRTTPKPTQPDNTKKSRFSQHTRMKLGNYGSLSPYDDAIDKQVDKYVKDRKVPIRKIKEEKKMTKAQIKKRDEIADAISTREMNKRYGDKNVKYAIATKLAMKEDVLDERLRPLIKGASYLVRKAMKARAKTPMGGVLAALKPTPKKSQLSQFAMYHGTSSKSAGKIMKSGKFKKSIGDVMNPDGSMYTGKRAFATTDPKRAKEYADMTAKYSGGKPEVLAVKVRDSNIMNPSGIPDEYYVKTKHMKPVGRGVKPIKIKKGQVMQNSFNPMEENTAIESELVIQDWNVDDIKFTEIETVDIIKAKSLKENKFIDFVRNIGKSDVKKEIQSLKDRLGPPPDSVKKEIDEYDPDDYIRGVKDKNKKKKKFPMVKVKSLKDFEKEAMKIRTEQKSNWRDELDEDWQKVNRKDKTDGLSKAAVKAYRRENPGSKLQTAVTKDPKKLKKGSKSAKRRLSFCRRMKGMKKKLTSAKTRRDPDSRINKALRRWNC